jgi:hypothetical protein
MSIKLFCGGEGAFSYFLKDLLGVFLGEGGSTGGGGSSKSGYLIPVKASFNTIV